MARFKYFYDAPIKNGRLKRVWISVHNNNDYLNYDFCVIKNNTCTFCLESTFYWKSWDKSLRWNTIKTNVGSYYKNI